MLGKVFLFGCFTLPLFAVDAAASAVELQTRISNLQAQQEMLRKEIKADEELESESC